MSTSGATSFTITRNQIIEQALGYIQKFGIGDRLQAEDANACAMTLNMMIKQWQQEGINITLMQDIAVFLENGKATYKLGANGDNASTEYTQTTVKTAGVLGDTTVELTAKFADTDAISLAQNNAKSWYVTTGVRHLNLNGAISDGGTALMPMPAVVTITSDADESGTVFTITGLDTNGKTQVKTVTGPTAGATTSTTDEYASVSSVTYPTGGALVGNVSIGYDAALKRITTGELDFYGITQDNNTIHWDTLLSSAPFSTGTTAALNSPLTYAAAALNPVFFYKTKASRPLDIISARLKNSSGNISSLWRQGSKEEALNNNSTVTGTPSSFWYDPTIEDGTLYVWPAPTDIKSVLLCQSRLPIEVLDSSGDTASFPQEWGLALIQNLAVNIAPLYEVIPSQMLAYQSMRSLDIARRSENQNRSLQIAPRLRRGRKFYR